MKFIFICIFTAILLSACNTGLPKSDIEKVTSLELEVDNTSEDFAEIDTAKINQLSKKYFENIDYFKTNFKDTVEKKLAIYIDRYYGLNKPILFLQNDYAVIAKELKTTQQQLKDLKHDAEEGLVDAEYFERYLDLERENSETVIQNAEKMTRTYHKTTAAYKKMSSKIDSIIQTDKKEKEEG